MAKSFGVRNYGNMKKEILIDHLVPSYINKDLYTDGSDIRRELEGYKKQCPFQLMNILIFHESADDFSGACDSPSCAQLDSGDAYNNCRFWIRVQAAFIEPHPVYVKLQFTDDVHFVNSAINPGENIQPNDWKKLQAIWIYVNSNYKQSLHDFT